MPDTSPCLYPLPVMKQPTKDEMIDSLYNINRWRKQNLEQIEDLKFLLDNPGDPQNLFRDRSETLEEYRSQLTRQKVLRGVWNSQLDRMKEM